MSMLGIIIVAAILGISVAIIVSRRENKKYAEMEQLLKDTEGIVDKFRKEIKSATKNPCDSMTLRYIVEQAFISAIARMEKSRRGSSGHIIFMSDVKKALKEVLADMDKVKA